MKSMQVSPARAGLCHKAWQKPEPCAWGLGRLPGRGRAVPDAAPLGTAGPSQARDWKPGGVKCARGQDRAGAASGRAGGGRAFRPGEGREPLYCDLLQYCIQF